MKNCPSFTVVPVNHPAKYEAFSFVGIGRTKVEPYSTVIVEDVPSGKFSLHRKIRLPRYISKGDYVLEFEVNQHSQSSVHRCLWAKRCANIHVEGNFEQFGHALLSRWEGFMGLESC